MSGRHNPEARTKFVWSEEAKADLRRLYLDEDKSASACAEALTAAYKEFLSERSVRSKLQSLKIKKGKLAKPKPQEKPKAARKKLSVISNITGSPVRKSEPQKPYFPPQTVVPGARKVTIMALKSCECRWPVTDHAPFFFCGLRATDGPYCEGHKKASRPADMQKAEAEMMANVKYAGGGNA